MRSSQILTSVVVVYDRAVGRVWSQGGLRPSFKFRGTLICFGPVSGVGSFGIGWQRYTEQTTQKKETEVSEGSLVEYSVYALC